VSSQKLRNEETKNKFKFEGKLNEILEIQKEVTSMRQEPKKGNSYIDRART
jgi:hypothetical protein